MLILIVIYLVSSDFMLYIRYLQYYIQKLDVHNKDNTYNTSELI